MATILIFLDLDEGHSFPIFRLLKRLKARGHRVLCLGLARIGDWVRSHGFEFRAIIDDVLPKEFGRLDCFETTYVRDGLRELYLGPLVRGQVLDPAIAELKPDAGVFLCNYYIESLVVFYRYRLPIVLFVPACRTVSRQQACEAIIDTLMNLQSGAFEMIELLTTSGAPFKSLRELSHLLLQMPELMSFPESFDLPGSITSSNVYYLGDGVDLERTEEPFHWNGFNTEQPLIYCALGSQNHLALDTSRRFFQKVILTATAHADRQYIISIGKMLRATDFEDVPANVTLSSWVPQLTVLARSSLMINHGGFGTVKECVLMGVPMLVFPLMPGRDMDPCAERVVFHGLGLRGDIERVSACELDSMIEQVLTDPAFRQRVKSMRELFKQQDRLDRGVEVIEQVIAASQQRTL
ncbi:MAG TPA: nucleotide disphospho-sugar-binding domain-containing protein [Pyrinomonadaceae bacterium]|nr:nucleotide disphospho-sugar-binding domain-containing protein [Pyrinomonadaceae bacterium]